MNELQKSPPLRDIDPILMAVLANRLNAIVREMANTLLKTARSAVLAVVRDFSCSIVTGDNRHVAAHVAQAIGLDPHAMLNGEELAAMRDEALWQRAGGIDLFVEVDPQQKARIVGALQKSGFVVGYLGDGINDAPSLVQADVGISVDGAVSDLVVTAATSNSSLVPPAGLVVGGSGAARTVTVTPVRRDPGLVTPAAHQ